MKVIITIESMEASHRREGVQYDKVVVDESCDTKPGVTKRETQETQETQLKEIPEEGILVPDGKWMLTCNPERKGDYPSIWVEGSMPTRTEYITHYILVDLGYSYEAGPAL